MCMPGVGAALAAAREKTGGDKPTTEGMLPSVGSAGSASAYPRPCAPVERPA